LPASVFRNSNPSGVAEKGGKAGHRDTPVGRQVDEKKLLDMKAYLHRLAAPKGAKVDAAVAARGKEVFAANCATCHNAEPSKPVPPTVVALDKLWLGYKPAKLADRKPPLSPVENSPGGFDDKMVVVDASERGEKRGASLPLLLDLGRKPRFLHDDSVPSLDSLLDPERGAESPHAFYLKDAGQRADVVAVRKGLEIPGAGEGSKIDPPAKDADLPTIKKPAPSPRSLPTIPPPDADAAEVPSGYRVEVVLTGLQYPSSVEFDDRGSMYVAEAGNIDGDWVAPARVIKYTQTGPNTRTNEVVADNLMGPVTDLLWHGGKLYISHRGKISVLEAGKVRDLVTELPSFGDHHNNQMSVGPDGKVYFGQGTATNSGVVGVDNYLLGWLAPYPDFSDRPGKDIVLRGQAFESADPLTALSMNKARTVKTSAFQPFGKTAPADTTVKGTAKATGAVLRMDADGQNLEIYAWGLRNPFGVMWGPDGKLYASDNGADERGVRPIANCPDNLWEIKKDAWYGWPDFISGEPVTDPKFKPKGGPAPEFLLKDHPKVEKPLATFEPHASVTKIDFGRGRAFGADGQMFLAASGDYTPATALEQKRAGYWVKRIDPTTGKGEVFFRCKPDKFGPKDMEYVVTAGPKRPVDVKFSPTGDALYVVDIGAVAFVTSGQGPTPRPFPGTGVVWRITRAVR
jgi:glucose/arabinose dehydrogenase/cytochrome c553